MRTILAVIALVPGGTGGISRFEARRDARASHSSIALGGASPSGTGSLVANQRPPTDFTLADMNGQPFSFSQLRGKPPLPFFGFTQCPGVCPITLGADGDKAQFVLIGSDPERDTHAALKQYLAACDPCSIGLRGDDTILARIAPDHDLTERTVPLPSDGDTVEPTATSFLIDAQGRLRVIYPHGVPGNALARDARTFSSPSCGGARRSDTRRQRDSVWFCVRSIWYREGANDRVA